LHRVEGSRKEEGGWQRRLLLRWREVFGNRFVSILAIESTTSKNSNAKTNRAQRHAPHEPNRNQRRRVYSKNFSKGKDLMKGRGEKNLERENQIPSKTLGKNISNGLMIASLREDDHQGYRYRRHKRKNVLQKS